MAWQNNSLVMGPPYTLVSGLALGTGSNPHGNLVRTGDSEWTFCYGDAVDFRLFSFEPGLTSATITRNWQTLTPTFGTGTVNFPVYYGDRLVIAQRGSIDSFYRLSEVMLNNGSFAFTLDGAAVGNGVALTSNFAAMRIDSGRMLLLGVGGSFYNMGQLGLLQRAPTGATLQAIMTDILNRAGYAGSDYDVTALSGVTVDGYVLQEPMTARNAIEPLQVFSPFDLVENADILVAVPRSANVATSLPASEWRAAQEQQEPPPSLAVTRAQELDLPVEVDVDYIDASRDFELGSQRARRIATAARAVQKIAIPIVCVASLAKQIAEARLYTLWAERELVKLAVSRRYLALTPGDVIDLQNGSLLRIARVTQVGGLMQIEGFYVTAAVQSSDAAADTGQIISRPDITPIDSTLYVMNLPLLQATDDQPGIYAAATGLAGWTGASLYRSSDGINYSTIGTLDAAAISGIATTALANQQSCYMDRSSSVNVQVLQGTLSSCSLTDLYNGANACLLGSEIIQFQTATLIGPGLYTLTNLLRARRGTESATASHVIGENFVMLTSGVVKFFPGLLTDRGSSYDFRALTFGQSLNDAQDNAATYNLTTIQPFAPVNITGSRTSGTGSDLTLVWKRRARLNAEWVSYIDVPLDEAAELYDVDIMNGATAMRTFSSLTTPTVTYTAAMQSSDWGTVPASFTVNIYQISSRYGRGQAGIAML